MRLWGFPLCVALVAAAVTPLVGEPLAAAPDADSAGEWRAKPEPAAAAAPLPWRQNTFAIPFRVNRPTEADDSPVEVRLFLSVDHGANWQFVQSAQPDAGRFVFRAPQDGEYWFSLRTVDRVGRVTPDEPHRGELRVNLDTLPPRLDLTGRRGDAGQVEVQWQALDPHLDGESLKIEYQAGADGAWQPLALTPAPATAGTGTRIGHANWWPQNPRGPILIRGEISDRAGNRTVSQTQVALDAPAANVGASVAAAPPTAQYAPNTPIPFNKPIIPAQVGGAGQVWPADQVAARPFGSTAPSASPPPSSHYQPPLAPAPLGAPAPLFSNNTSANPPAEENQPAPAASSLYRTASQSRELPNPGIAPPASDSAPNNLRMVNNSKFELQYDVEAVGPAGIAKVEIWSTRDEGRTWLLHTVDQDNRSPAQVEVAGEGLYGFCIVVQASNGLGSRVPTSGDPAEVWVGVDTNRPQVQLVSALPGTGNQSDHLIIKWEAADARLESRPISLFYAVAPNATWQTVAVSLENTGSYAWRLDPNVPDEVYLRIEARDAAGNVADHTYPQSAKIYRPRPQGRIRNVLPVGK